MTLKFKIGNRLYKFYAEKLPAYDQHQTITNIGWVVSVPDRREDTEYISNNATVLQIIRYGHRMRIGIHKRKQLLQKQ